MGLITKRNKRLSFASEDVTTHRFWRAAFARMRFVRKDFWDGYLVNTIVMSISV